MKLLYEFHTMFLSICFLILSCAIVFCIANTLYQFAVKREAVGIWGCKDCGKVKAGGAYTMKYVMMSSYSVYIEFSMFLVVMSSNLLLFHFQRC